MTQALLDQRLSTPEKIGSDSGAILQHGCMQEGLRYQRPSCFSSYMLERVRPVVARPFGRRARRLECASLKLSPFNSCNKTLPFLAP